ALALGARPTALRGHAGATTPTQSRGHGTHAEDSDHRLTSKGVSRRRWLIPTVLLTIPFAIAGIAAWRHFTTAPPPSMSPTGVAAALFRGTLVDWQTLRGSWRIDKDAEGATVIAGTEGVIRRSLPAYDHYSLAVGADLHKATAVELHFGLEPYPSAVPSPGPPR